MKQIPDFTSSYDGIKRLAADLRDKNGGCPWDLKQDHFSLKNDILEETYELLASLDNLKQQLTENPPQATHLTESIGELKEELGDVLFQVVMQSQMATEKNWFNLDDVIRSLGEKLIRRHPHVYGEENHEDSQAVLENWEQIKRQERLNKGKDLGKQGMLEGLPRNLPALLLARRYGEKAARVNFDWPKEQAGLELLGKLEEEIKEFVFEAAKNLTNPDNDMIKKNMQMEFGDILFVMAQIGRHLGIDGEEALQQANKKFAQRFGFMENMVAERLLVGDLPSLSEWETLWQQAKQQRNTANIQMVRS